ncbi:RagB/SusD family nutrient uptake outer membrane protein [Spirosoma endbachense]|uniref:RagB/SusD family nutrient uptake outer membrane protein n=1 Tax=Spirosoma endbachense TaxID=2666025 RepID=A0A6P1W5G5_9BACT|nr:RagB/SusD family nutrient uptake outer membrane protein [Spirosoma endbachense]QHW00135.1 RagB/SusD family nutrient uptake outer membrane protein [Spirosoma endbachense]
MRKLLYPFIISCLGVGGLISCDKSYLDKSTYGTLDAASLANKNGLESLLIGSYSMLDGYSVGTTTLGSWSSAASNWVYGSIAGGDAHKGSTGTDQPEINAIEAYIPIPTNGFFSDKWKVVYEGVTRANIVLKTMPGATDISAADRKRIEGEARFLRAHYHFEAKKMWNLVPFIDETMTDFQVPNVKVNVANDQNIWPRIQADLQFAYDNLPELQGAIGRANKWSAGAMLGKCLLFQKKYAEAKVVLEQVYQRGVNPSGVKYGLLDKYQDNFNAATKNSRESIFASQSSVNDGASAANANYGDVLNAPYGGPFDCCGFFQPSQDLVNSYKVSATGLPDFDTYNTNPVTSDEGIAITDPFTPYSGTVDSRLDWTVGRRGIPFLDYGPHQGISWQRDQAYGGPYNTKKNVYYKSQKGTLTDGSFWASTVTAINTNLIRFADVILWLAECEAEGGDLTKARAYVNEVRARAAKSSSWVMKDGTNSPAANYKVGLYEQAWPDQATARKAVHFERKLELGMEGHRFFDLVRWGEAESTLTKYLQYESTLRTYLVGVKFTAGKNEYFPIPQRQIDLSNNVLKQNTGY